MTKYHDAVRVVSLDRDLTPVAMLGLTATRNTDTPVWISTEGPCAVRRHGAVSHPMGRDGFFSAMAIGGGTMAISRDLLKVIKWARRQTP